MAHLIDKDALLADIEKLKSRFQNGSDEDYANGYHYALKLVKRILDTLEVKEVDLEQEPASEDLEQAANQIVNKVIPTLAQKYKDGTYVGCIRDCFDRKEFIDLVKAGAQWQKEQDFNDFTRLKKSWYEEGKIHGKFEGLSDDVKYQQGFHDVKEQIMKNATEGWVARDKDGGLYLYSSKPVRYQNFCWNRGIDKKVPYELPKEMFPNQHWEDEPQKVLITIETIELND